MNTTRQFKNTRQPVQKLKLTRPKPYRLVRNKLQYKYYGVDDLTWNKEIILDMDLTSYIIVNPKDNEEFSKYIEYIGFTIRKVEIIINVNT